MYSRFGIVFALLVFNLHSPAHAGAQKRFVTPIDGSWLEVERITKGRSDTKPDYMCGYKFNSNMWYNWARVGELQPLYDKCRIDTSTKPNRIDLFSTKRTGSRKPKVKVGIFKVENGRLILATSARWVEVRKWSKDKDYPNRPKEFQSTKYNDVRVSVMVRCEYLDQEVPKAGGSLPPKARVEVKPRPKPKLVGLKPGVWGAVYVEGRIPTAKKWVLDPAMKRHAGKTHYTDETWLVGRDNGLANCVVTLHPVSKVRPAVKPIPQAVLDKVDVRYVPRVLVVTPGTPVLLRNRASPCRGFAIDSQSGTLGNGTNLRILEGNEQVMKFQGPDLCTVACPARRYTKGFVHVVDTACFAVTDKDGRFSVADVPPGKYRIRVWHEANGYVSGDAGPRVVEVGTKPQKGLLFKIQATKQRAATNNRPTDEDSFPQGSIEAPKKPDAKTHRAPGEIVLSLKKNERVAALCFSPDNRFLYTALVRSQNFIDLARWDLRTKERKSFGSITRGQLVRKLEWDRGQLVVQRQEWIGWFDAKSGKLRAKLAQQYKPVLGLCYEEWLDGRLVKSACRPGQYHLKLTLAGDRVLFMDLQRRRRAYIVDYRKGRDIRGIKLPRESEDGILQRFVVSQDGSVGVVSTFALDPGRKILIWSWDLRTGKQLQAMSYTPRNSAITIPNLLALNRDGTYIATTPSILSREIHVLNARTGKTVHVCRIGSGCSALVASPKAAEFACYLDCSIEVWNMATGKRIARFKEDHAAEDSGGLAYSPDGTRLAWVGEQIRVVTIPAVRRE